MSFLSSAYSTIVDSLGNTLAAPLVVNQPAPPPVLKQFSEMINGFEKCDELSKDREYKCYSSKIEDPSVHLGVKINPEERTVTFYQGKDQAPSLPMGTQEKTNLIISQKGINQPVVDSSSIIEPSPTATPPVVDETVIVDTSNIPTTSTPAVYSPSVIGEPVIVDSSNIPSTNTPTTAAPSIVGETLNVDTPTPPSNRILPIEESLFSRKNIVKFSAGGVAIASGVYTITQIAKIIKGDRSKEVITRASVAAGVCLASLASYAFLAK